MNLKSKAVKCLLPLLVLLIVSCGGKDSGVGATNAVVNGTEISSLAIKKVYFDNLGQIPVQGSNKEFIIRLHNDYDKQFILESVQVINPLTNDVDKQLATIKIDMCKTVPAANSCAMSIKSYLKTSGSFILQANLRDITDKSKLRTVEQFIRVSDKIPSVDGIIFENDLSKVVSLNSVYHLAMPVVLTENFDQIKVRNGSIKCQNGYQAGSSCTYFVDIKSSINNTLIETKLEAYRKDSLVVSKSYSITGTNQSRANLLISQPNDVYIGVSGESQTSIFFYNAGSQAATNIIFKLTDSSMRFIRTNRNCEARLEAGSSCQIRVAVNSQINGAGSVKSAYSYKEYDSASIDSTNANIIYINNASAANLVLSPINNNLKNLVVGIKESQIIRLQNTGERVVTNISYVLDKGEPFQIKGIIYKSTKACSLNGSLEPYESCMLIVNYTPDTSTDGSNLSYNIYAVGDYKTNQDQMATIVNNISQEYSVWSVVNVLAFTPESVTLVAKVENTESEVLNIKNVSRYSVTVGTLGFSPLIDDLSFTSANTASDCSSDLLIDSSQECAVKLVYSPQLVTAESTTDFEVPITKIANTNIIAGTKAIAKVTVEGRKKDANYAKVNVRIEPQALEHGVSYENDIYKILALPSTSLKLDYIFTAESGLGDALQFNVSNSALPIGAQIINNDSHINCSTGISLSDLKAGDSCYVTVQVPQLSLYGTGILGTGSIINIILSYSWQSDDPSISAPTTFEKLYTNLQVIDYSTQWLILPISGELITASNFLPIDTNQTDVEATITATFDDVVKDANVIYPITVTAKIDGTVVNESSCIIDEQTIGNTCSTKLRMPYSAPNGTYYIDVQVKDNSQRLSYTFSKVVTKDTK